MRELQQGSAAGGMGVNLHFAWQHFIGSNVRFGPQADMGPASRLTRKYITDLHRAGTERQFIIVCHSPRGSAAIGFWLLIFVPGCQRDQPCPDSLSVGAFSIRLSARRLTDENNYLSRESKMSSTRPATTSVARPGERAVAKAG
jgi:hypothetical protein